MSTDKNENPLFETYRAIIMEEPSLPGVFKKAALKLAASNAPRRAVEFAEWNADTLEHCVQKESIDELMAWEATLRNFLAGTSHDDAVLHRVLTSRLNKLLFAHSVASLETLSM